MKPSRLARDVEKWKRRRAVVSQKQNAARHQATQWRALSATVKSRDGGRCRACSRQTVGVGGDPRLIGAAHHIVFRSQGGSDDLSNVLWLCGECHDGAHRHLLVITGTADGISVAVGQ